MANVVKIMKISASVSEYTSSLAMAQRPREACFVFSINVQLHSQNYKIAFLSHPIGAFIYLFIYYLFIY